MQNLDYDDIWDHIFNQIKGYGEVDPNQLTAFFSRLHLQAFSTGFIMLTADNEFIKNWIERNYLGLINRALTDLYQQEFMVNIVVDEAEAARHGNPALGVTPAATAAAPSPAAPAQAAPLAPAPGTAPSAPTPTAPSAQPAPVAPQTTALNPTTPAPSGVAAAFAAARAAAQAAAPAASPAQTMPIQGAPAAQPAMPASTAQAAAQPGTLQQPGAAPQSTQENHLTRTISNLTFENYVIGNSNRMAYSMALAVAEKPGMPHLNPLFIYGKSGVGKTHLLRAIQNRINASTNGFLKTVYVNSTEFINDYANASADHSQEKASFKNFKKNYEDADVLLIDDVQSFQGKTQTLEIIFQLFNSLTSAGKQVVMSADIAPKNIDIDERYTSRFNQGATFDIQAPEIETKHAIVTAFIKEYQESENRYDLVIPDEVQEYIAENSSSNIRELKSAVTKIIYQMIYTQKTDITTDEVAVILENHFSGGKTKRLTVGDIQKEVESFYRVSHEDLISKKRNRSIAHPRQVAMYLCRQLLDNNAYQRIGDEFGKKDHTTVMHSVQLIETKAKENKEVREEIDIIIKRIREN